MTADQFTDIVKEVIREKTLGSYARLALLTPLGIIVILLDNWLAAIVLVAALSAGIYERMTAPSDLQILTECNRFSEQVCEQGNMVCLTNAMRQCALVASRPNLTLRSKTTETNESEQGE